MSKKSKTNKLIGGIADNNSPSDFDQHQLDAGIAVELEHTSDKTVAQEIAMDHLKEDPEYYKKLKEIEKYDRVETESDGKKELDYGNEDLEKLKTKWKKLKKAINADSAFLDLSSAESTDDDEQDAQSPEQVDKEEDKDAKEPEAQSDNQPTEQESEQQVDDTASSPAPVQSEAVEDGEKATDENSEEDQKLEEVIQFLRDEGYDDSEISFIVHNHSLPIPTKDDVGVQNEAAKGEAKLSHMKESHELSQQHAQDSHHQEREQDRQEHELRLAHKKRMHDVEYAAAKSELIDPEMVNTHKKRMLDLEHEIEAKKKEEAQLQLEHKKRMLDLEYEKARQEAGKKDPKEDLDKQHLEFELEMKRLEKQVELEHKKKELAIKLKLAEEAAKQKAEQKQVEAKNNAKKVKNNGQ